MKNVLTYLVYVLDMFCRIGYDIFYKAPKSHLDLVYKDCFCLPNREVFSDGNVRTELVSFSNDQASGVIRPFQYFLQAISSDFSLRYCGVFFQSTIQVYLFGIRQYFRSWHMNANRIVVFDFSLGSVLGKTVYIEGKYILLP